MNLEQAVKPITFSVLTLGIIITVYVLWVSKQDDTSKPAATQQQSSIRSAPRQQSSTVTETKVEKFIPDRSQDEGLPKFTDMAEKVTDINELSPDIKVRGGRDEINFEPEAEMDYREIAMVIALPNGKQITQKFSAGEAIVFADKTLEDGFYKWESHATPKIEPSIRQEMAAIRKSGNPDAEQALIDELREDGYLPSAQQVEANTQSGYFTIKNGAIVSGETTEENNYDPKKKP